MAPLGIGFVGGGMVGQLCHLANFLAVPDCRVVALAELRPELGRRVAEKFGVPRVYSTHHELLANRDVEAVVVVTRRAATGPIVLDALASGRHVLSEKPMAHTAEQGRRLAAKAAEGGLVYAIGCMKRHDAGVARAKALVDRLRASGEMGPLARVRAWSRAGDTGDLGDGFVMTEEPRPDGLDLWPATPDWLPAERAADYDAFLNVHVHIINLLRYFMGGTPAVTGAAIEGSRAGHATFDFSGVPGTLEFGAEPPPGWHEGIEFIFAGGSVRVELPAPFVREAEARISVQRDGEAAETLPASARPVWAFRRQAEALVEDVAARRPPLAPGADAVEDLVVAEAVWRALLR